MGYLGGQNAAFLHAFVGMKCSSRHLLLFLLCL